MTAVVDNMGDVEERYAYTPYGRVTFLDSSFAALSTQESDIDNDLLYTGRRRDPETGLQLNRNRFYASHLGRWVNRDPVGYADSWNLYEYVGGMPISNLDPDGLVAIGAIIKGIGNTCKKIIRGPLVDFVSPCSAASSEEGYAEYKCGEVCALTLCGPAIGYAAANDARRFASQSYTPGTPEHSALRHCITTALIAKRCNNCVCAFCVNKERDWYQTNCKTGFDKQGEGGYRRALSAGIAGVACAGCAGGLRPDAISDSEIASCCLKRVKDGGIDLGLD